MPTTGAKTSSQRDAQVLGDVGEHRRPPHRALALAAGEHGRARGARLVEPLADPVGVRRVDHRADVGRLVERVADDERLDAADELGGEPRRRRPRGRRRAGRRCTSGRRRRSRPRRRARPRSRRRRRRGRSRPRCRRARASPACGRRGVFSPQPTTGLPVNVSSLMRSSSTSGPRRVGRAREHGDAVLGPAGLEHDPAEQERAHRRLRRGPQQDRVAGGERRGDLVRDEVEREVERRDAGDRPERDAADLAPRGPRCRAASRAARARRRSASTPRPRPRRCRRRGRPRRARS